MGNFSDKEMKKIIYDDFTPKNEDSPNQKSFLEQITSNKSLFKSLLNKIKRSKNVIYDIQVSADRIYVFLVNEDITTKNQYPVEVYNLKGRQVYHGYFREIPTEIWKDYVFLSERDKADNPIILKFKIDDQEMN